jgi:predicted ATPase
VEALKANVTHEPHAQWECRCSPYFRDSALHPIIDLFSRLLEFRREDTGAEKFEKLTAALRRHGLGHPDTVALWAALLSLPLPDGYPGLTLAARRQRQRALDAILALLMQVARQETVLLVVEDLQWVDPSTLELLELLVDHVADAAVCMVLTFRPDVRPSWSDRPYLTCLSVGRLSPDQTELMVASVAGERSLPAETVREVVTRTDGVPLFVEELTKMVLESGLLRELPERHELPTPLPRPKIPSTLRDSLMARLDGLPIGKGVAQVGATLGRSFSYELVQAVTSQSEDVLQRELRALVDAGLLYQRGTLPGATYIFKHSLVQEAAYESLLKRSRQRYHRQIARVLVERFPDVADTQPELPAHHFTEAGLPHEATGYWQKAGQLAIQRSANAEAIAHFTRGLALVRRLDAGPARDQREVELRLALGTAIVARQGYGAPEVAETLDRARSLVTGLGESPQIFPVRWALWRFCLARADLRAAEDLADQLLATTGRESEPGRTMASHVATGVTGFYLGEFARARNLLGQALAPYDPAQGQALALAYGQDLGIGALGFLGWTDAITGDLAAAADRSDAALRLARKLAHPFSLALALFLAGEVRQLRREPGLVLEFGHHLLEVAREHSFVFFEAFGLLFTGWARVATGDVSAGLTTMREGADLFRSVGQRVGLAHRAHFAEVLIRAGQPTDAIEVVTDALQRSEESGETAFGAELHRVRGEALTRLASFPDAKRCFQRALDLASAQGAWLFALRAACGLVRLTIATGSAGEETRDLLAQMTARFSSGLDVGDLRDARALLVAGR